MASPPTSSNFIIIAHRGDSSAAPENTLEAFDLALSQGFTNFETDCQLSADGVPIILHDETLGRVNNGSGPAAAASLEQLQQLDAGSWFSPDYAGARIPTLQEVLVKYRGQVHMHLELKSQQPSLPEAVASLVRQMQWVSCQQPPHGNSSSNNSSGAAQQQPSAGAVAPVPAAAAAVDVQQQSIGGVPGLTITSFHLQQLQASKQLLPEVTHGWLIQEVTPEVIHTAKQAGFQMVCPRANALTPEGVRALNQEGFRVRAWGVKTIELLHHVVKCGVDGATVNWPQQAADALRE